MKKQSKRDLGGNGSLNIAGASSVAARSRLAGFGLRGIGVAKLPLALHLGDRKRAQRAGHSARVPGGLGGERAVVA